MGKKSAKSIVGHPFKVDTTRWVNIGDPVPKLPPFGYKHVGKPYAISTGSDVCDKAKQRQAYQQGQDFSGKGINLASHIVHGSRGYANAIWKTQRHSTEGC